MPIEELFTGGLNGCLAICREFGGGIKEISPTTVHQCLTCPNVCFPELPLIVVLAEDDLIILWSCESLASLPRGARASDAVRFHHLQNLSRLPSLLGGS